HESSITGFVLKPCGGKVLFSDGVSASMMDINGQVITVDCGDQRNAFLLQRDRLKALMCARVAVPRWQRRVTGGVACCGAEPAVSLQNVQALEGEAFVAGHGCVTSGLIFEAHALEEPRHFDCCTLEEVRSKLASLLLPQLHYHASFNQSEHWGDCNDGSLAESYPNAGDEDGLILLDLWVLPSDLEEDHPTAASWRLPLAYGVVPAVKGMGPVGQETALLSRRQYKAQVASAVRSTAVNGCDALLVACSTERLRAGDFDLERPWPSTRGSGGGGRLSVSSFSSTTDSLLDELRRRVRVLPRLLSRLLSFCFGSGMAWKADRPQALGPQAYNIARRRLKSGLKSCGILHVFSNEILGMAPKAGGVVGLVLIRDLAETLQLGAGSSEWLRRTQRALMV
ncbi:unnamed protein product, partial [Cladocopium goreaui]